ncbi:velvet factor-domain-containing protein [Xylogone sp. PMI_703]|nr:velvet factor-domain-containing protein [Xylogone sp. PMI_703]
MHIICQNRGEPSSGCSTLLVNHRPCLLESAAATLPSKFSPSNRERHPEEPQFPKPEATDSMNTVQASHEFADAATAQIPELQSHDCQLIIKQKPENARLAIGKEKDRKPVDPPPIIQLKISPASDPAQNYLQSPYFFMTCSLVGLADGRPTPEGLSGALGGTVVSSLHRLKDTDNQDGAFFVFGDLSVKLEGQFRLQFSLYEMRGTTCYYIKSIISEPFTVYPGKSWPGMAESTFLTRSFSDQGVRLRLRKEPRALLRKRGPASEDYQPRHYRTQARQQSESGDKQSYAGGGNESDETPRTTSVDQVGNIKYEMQSGVYDQRGGYGHHSHGSFSSYPDDHSSKRSRTSSDQSQTLSFSHPSQSLESPQFQPRLYSDPQHNPQYMPFASSQQQTYNLGYTQSPDTPSREQYSFTQRSSTAQSPGPLSPFDTGNMRSPAVTNYYAPQTQARFNPMSYSTIPQVIGTASPRMSYDNLGFGSTQRDSPSLSSSSMGLSTSYGRMNPNSSYAAMQGAAAYGRREGYEGMLSTGQDFAVGTRTSALPYSAGLDISTSAAPGSLEGTF